MYSRNVPSGWVRWKVTVIAWSSATMPVTVARLARLVRARADDAGVPAHVRRVDLEDALDRPLHVGGAHGPVDGRREAHARTDVERVDEAAVGDLRQRGRQIGHDLRPGAAPSTPERHQPVVGRLEDLPALGRGRERAVEVVGIGRDARKERPAAHRRPTPRSPARRGRAAPAGAGRGHHEQCHRDRESSK